MKVVKTVVVTGTKWVTHTAWMAVSAVLNTAAFVVGLALSIPVVGRIVAMVLNTVLNYLWTGLGFLVDRVVERFADRPTKRLRICLIVLRDGDGEPVVEPSAMGPEIEAAREIFRREANVELDVVDANTTDGPAPEHALSVGCNGPGLIDDMWITGAYFERSANCHCFESSFTRLVGLGAPVVAFVVREVERMAGCSFTHFSDYVTLEAEELAVDERADPAEPEAVADGGGPLPRLLAHELGHACGLFHEDDPDNLLTPGADGTSLTPGQVRQLRASPRVTYG